MAACSTDLGRALAVFVGIEGSFGQKKWMIWMNELHSGAKEAKKKPQYRQAVHQGHPWRKPQSRASPYHPNLQQCHVPWDRKDEAGHDAPNHTKYKRTTERAEGDILLHVIQ